MSIDKLYPFAGDHAIQSAVFVLEFGSELSPEELQKLEYCAKDLEKDFPDKRVMQSLAFNIESNIKNSDSKVQAAQHYGGFTLLRPPAYPGAQPARQLQVNSANIVIVIADYSRWTNKIKNDIERYWNVFFDSLENLGKPLNTIGVQYNDLFNWKADPSELNISEVLRTDCPFVAPNVFKLPNGELWHSHHGYFVYPEYGVPGKQLNNVNVGLVHAEQTCSVQILTSQKFSFDRPIFKYKDSAGELHAILDRMHSENKSLLNSIVSVEVARKIKLNEGG